MQEIAWKRMTLRDYWQLLCRRKWHIVIPFLAVTMIAIPASFFITPRYRAETVLVSEEMERGSILRGLASIPIADHERLDTVRQKIYTRTNMLQVAERLGMQSELQERKPTETTTPEDVVRYLRKIIQMKLLSGKFIQISASHSNPDRAAEVANTVADVYVNNTLTYRQEEVFASYRFIQEQLEIYSKRLSDVDTQLAAAKESGVLQSLTDNNLAAIESATQIDAQLVQLEVDIQSTQSLLARLRGTAAAARPGETGDYYVYTDPRIISLDGRILSLEQQRDQLLRRYDSQWPAVRNLLDQLDGLYREMEMLRSEPGSRINISEQIREQEGFLVQHQIQKKQLLAQKVQHDRKLAQLEPVSLALSPLIREKMTSEKVYDMLLTRLNEADILRASEAKNMGIVARVWDTAFAPEQPFSPNKTRIALMAMAIGLAMGAAMALVVEVFDHSIRSIEEAAAHFPKVPTVGIVPEILTPEKRRSLRRRKVLRWIVLTLGFFLMLAILMDVVRVQFLGAESYFSLLAESLVSMVESATNG